MDKLTIAENLFSAIDTLIERKFNNLAFNRTIIGEIIEVKENGWYKIKHSSYIFEAYNINKTEEYQPGARVYILIINNQQDNTKLILSSLPN